jgi:hypothetical protein
MARAIKISTDGTVTEVDLDLLDIPAVFELQPRVIASGRISDGIDTINVGHLTDIRPVILAIENRHENTDAHNESATRLVVPKVDRFHGSIRNDSYIVGEGALDIFENELTDLPEALTVKEVLRRIDHYENL